jgi:AbrB family looped-hinge helix DNA binding protein
MRMTSKGQVTVPKRLRELADIGPGSEIDFDFENGKITLSKGRRTNGSAKTRGERVVEALRNTRTVNRELTTDEIMRLMRGDG